MIVGTEYSDAPIEKVKQIRDKNRRTGLGLMGIHEWLIKKNYPYDIPLLRPQELLLILIYDQPYPAVLPHHIERIQIRQIYLAIDEMGETFYQEPWQADHSHYK